MFKVSTKFSNNLSLAIAILFLVGCVTAAFLMPTVTNMLIDTPDNIGDRGSITQGGRVFVHIVAYVLLAIVTLADVLSIALLLRIRKGEVFSEKSVTLIRGVSWCCILLCIAFALLGVYFQLALIMAFLALFLGLCLRVVKNVIEEATVIKGENDLTV
ncbi:MAG: DUF2975 domain-containing protein [Ruminococcus sp.]|nr:DUF2975 domain-containing protein [Ruminococcus sp.]